MGSLPNLHELDKQKELEGYKPGPALGHLCGGYNGPLTTEEKSKILQRHSGHAKITKARSNPQDGHKIVYDDFMLEHMAAYSPISTRSRSNLNQTTFKRKDSMSSSIGATSVRRLLAVVRGGAIDRSRAPPVYTTKVLILNLIVACFCHLLNTVAFLPFLTLQSSVSIWNQPSGNVTGSLLLSETYFFSAIFSLISPYVIKKLGNTLIISLSYGGLTCFYLCHLHPALYLTAPASLFLGLVLSLLSCANISFLMTLSHRITGLFHEDDEDSRQARRTCVIRRVARAFQGAQDVGLIVGSLLSAILITYTVDLSSGIEESVNYNVTLDCSDRNQTCSSFNYSPAVLTTFQDYNSFLDEVFDKGEDGRLCGAQACPVSYLVNSSSFRILPERTSEIVVSVYSGCAAAAAFLAIFGLDKIRMLVYQDPLERGEGAAALRAVRDSFKDRNLLMAAPLSLFIGMEQAFIHSDFSKSYVVCTLGIHRLNLVFLAMGVLQGIAALTLSMLLRTIRRYYVVGVGFTFHACLIMVLIVWKPIEDDPALFYVISASWGVCHAIWDMLNFTLLTGIYADNWEAAFANSLFFRSLGLCIPFLFHGLICNYLKLYFLALLMITAVVPFTWLEIRLENIRKIRNITRL